MSGDDATERGGETGGNWNPVVFGCAGRRLSAEERAFFREIRPFGFILFRRNCDSPDEVRGLVSDLREAVGRRAPVLIDQEGGRVARLRPPHWPEAPAAGRLGGLPPETARRAAYLHGRLLAALLRPLGIDVNCAPVADVPVPGAHDVIGDRAFSTDPAIVGRLARAQAEGLLAGGVLPVVKHLPGHGRARSDSHLELPVVEATWDELDRFDFAAFRAVADLPLGMVAHVLYPALDPLRPASVSPDVVERVIRQRIGFEGLLFSDDIGMRALAGSASVRVRNVLAGGCDIALHCSGDLHEMRDIAADLPGPTDLAHRRWRRAAEASRPSEEGDAAALAAELSAILADTGA